MTIDKIADLFQLGKSPVEIKSRCHNVDNIGPIVCGFLNASGGYVICGVDESGKVIGDPKSAELLGHIEQKLLQGLSPKAWSLYS